MACAKPQLVVRRADLARRETVRKSADAERRQPIDLLRGCRSWTRRGGMDGLAPVSATLRRCRRPRRLAAAGAQRPGAVPGPYAPTMHGCRDCMHAARIYAGPGRPRMIWRIWPAGSQQVVCVFPHPAPHTIFSHLHCGPKLQGYPVLKRLGGTMYTPCVIFQLDSTQLLSAPSAGCSWMGRWPRGWRGSGWVSTQQLS